MTTALVCRIAARSILALAAMTTLGCSDTVREGRSPAYLIVQRVEASSGAEDDEFSDELSSDVQTGGGVFEDLGRATFRLAMKDIGPSGGAAPTTNNFITVSRYAVRFRRTDGRNTPGVDVPYGFEGAGTVTISTEEAAMVFVLVRAQSKVESPLKELARGGAQRSISTIADITFYGRDQTGSDVSVSGSISVNFADWADPE